MMYGVDSRSVILISRPRAPPAAVNEALCGVNKGHTTRAAPPPRPPVVCPRISPFVPITPATLSECHHPSRRVGAVPYRHGRFPRGSVFTTLLLPVGSWLVDIGSSSQNCVNYVQYIQTILLYHKLWEGGGLFSLPSSEKYSFPLTKVG